MANKAKVAKSLEMSQGIISEQKPDFPFRVLEFQSTQSADLIQSTTMKANGATMKSKASLLIETNTESPPKPIVINGMSSGQTRSTILSSAAVNNDSDESNETSFDGYTTIHEANSSESREDGLKKMRAMRTKNMIKSSN